jgi:hypothetical protein
VPLLVGRMVEVQAPEQPVLGQLRRPGEISAAVGFRLRESKQLLRSPARISPDPAMQWAQQPIEP